jgi:hypothetical protein
LFNTADSERQGSIQGAKAVEFFSRSKLPLQKLKEIWIVADQPPTNALDPRKFAVAVRLIQLEQNGIRPSGLDLAASAPPNLRPAFFEGIPPPPPPSASFDGGASQPGAPPPRHPVAGVPQQQLPPQPPSNTQLVVHAADPYAMTPSEQARYEAVFPEYANKQDPDFLHGEDAFALFNKSGLPSQQLAAIWAMVDVPVDNKLDKLEFAMAMHLIVCVSKKNLPCPTALPQSLKQLKAQMPPQYQPGEATAPQPMSPPRPMAQPQPMMGGGGPLPPEASAHMRSTSNVSSVGGPMMGGGAFPSSSVSSGGMMMQPPMPQQPNVMPSSASTGGIPPPGRTNMGGGPPAYVNPPTMPSMVMTGGPSNVMSSSASTGGIPSPVRTMGGPPAFVNPSSNNMQSMVGPPPLQSRTVNISDAFEGIGNYADTGSISSFRATSPVVAATGHFAAAAEDDPPARSASPPSPPKTSQQLAANYDLGETSEELKKLRVTLQKLQAENIALRAQLGTMGEEEKDLQKELGATIAEITKLSNELTNMRAQVLASKSRLLDAASELKAAKEKKGYVQRCIYLTLCLHICHLTIFAILMKCHFGFDF